MVATEAAPHIEKLVALGWTQRGIATAAGISTGSVSKIRRWPVIVIDGTTAAAILAVR